MQLENIKNTARRNGYDLALIIYYGFIVSLGAVRFPLSVFQISCLSFSFITVFLTQIAFTHFALCMLSWQFFLCLFFFSFWEHLFYSSSRQSFFRHPFNMAKPTVYALLLRLLLFFDFSGVFLCLDLGFFRNRLGYQDSRPN